MCIHTLNHQSTLYSYKIRCCIVHILSTYKYVTMFIYVLHTRTHRCLNIYYVHKYKSYKRTRRLTDMETWLMMHHAAAARHKKKTMTNHVISCYRLSFMCICLMWMCVCVCEFACLFYVCTRHLAVLCWWRIRLSESRAVRAVTGLYRIASYSNKYISRYIKFCYSISQNIIEHSIWVYVGE